MMKPRWLIFPAIAGLLLMIPAAQAALTPVEELGKRLFFDSNLSNPPGQSGASCHDPATGWTGPDSAINATQAIYEGAIPHPFRQPQASHVRLCRV